jgi:DNA-binding MarR family transcriptional regulator
MDADFDTLVDVALYTSWAFVALAVRAMASSSTLTIPQHRALLELALRGPQSLTSLSRLLGMPPSGTSRLCDRLISRGLVSKRTSPSSGRSVELNVTERGAALIASIVDGRRDEMAKALAKIPAAGREALRDAMSGIADTLARPREPFVPAE